LILILEIKNVLPLMVELMSMSTLMLKSTLKLILMAMVQSIIFNTIPIYKWIIIRHFWKKDI